MEMYLVIPINPQDEKYCGKCRQKSSREDRCILCGQLDYEGKWWSRHKKYLRHKLCIKFAKPS